MPQSLDNVLVHVVFSTKNRAAFILEPHRAQTHAYLATIARDLNCHCLRAGGTNDHVHLAIQLARTITIADLVEKLKTSSSKWLKMQSTDLHDFAWQRGYGVFSVSPKDTDALLAYIDNQIEHHKTHTFQDEYRGFLKKYGIHFDERYVWD